MQYSFIAHHSALPGPIPHSTRMLGVWFCLFVALAVGAKWPFHKEKIPDTFLLPHQDKTPTPA
jgi:hypothetical protein